MNYEISNFTDQNEAQAGFPTAAPRFSRIQLEPDSRMLQVTGLLHRTNLADTLLADDHQTGSAVILTCLSPSYPFASEPYDSFVEIGKRLARRKHYSFHEEIRIENFGSREVGLVRTDTPEGETAVCAGCGATPSASALRMASKQIQKCQICSKPYGTKTCDIYLPAIAMEFQEHLTLKQAMSTVFKSQLAIPSKVYAHIIWETASQMMRIAKEKIPVAISSHSILLTQRGQLAVIPLPVLRNRNSLIRPQDVPVVAYEFFKHFLHLVPDATEDLKQFLLVPGIRTLKELRAEAGNAGAHEVGAWIRYVASPHARTENYTRVQEIMSANSRQMKTITMNLTREAVSEIRKSIPEKQKESLAHRMMLHMKKARKILAGSLAIAAISALAVAWSSSVPENPQPARKERRAEIVLDSMPPKLLRPTAASAALSNVSHVATARVLVSPTGQVADVKWVQGTNEQISLYSESVQRLAFRPAVSSGNNVAAWTTVQFPLR